MSLVMIGGSLAAQGLLTANRTLNGLSDPSLAMGEYFVDYWTTNQPFIDISRKMSYWYQPNGDSREQLIIDGVIDADTTNIIATTLSSPLAKAIAVRDAQDTYLNGAEFTMLWDGAGQMVAPSNSTVDSSATNEIEFTMGTVSGGAGMSVTATSGPISNLRIIPRRFLDRYNAGERVNPDYAEILKDVRAFRTMDSNNTNEAFQSTWASRPVMSMNSYSAGDWPFTESTLMPGTPLEFQIELWNKIKADPWLNFNYRADDTFVTNAATMLRDTVNPELLCRFENMNEGWNGGFSAQWAANLAAANALWPSAVGTDLEKVMSYIGYRTYQVGLILNTVFAGQLDRKCLTLGIGGEPPQIAAMLDAPIWEEHWDDADSTSIEYVAPYSVMDEMSGTGYIGVGLTFDSGRVAAIEAAAATSLDDSDDVIEAYLRTEGAGGIAIWSFEAITDAWGTLNGIAAVRSLGLSMYEGGPHMSYSEDATTHEAITHWIESDYGVTFINELYADWFTHSQVTGPYTQFQAVGDWRDGQWTPYEHMDDDPQGLFARLLVLNTLYGNSWGDTTDYRHGDL